MRKKVGKGRSEEEREREVGKGVGSVGGSKVGRELKRVALMEWDLKMPPWDLPELEQNAGEANLSSVVGSRGGSAERQPAVGLLDCSVDLKLGGLGDFGLVDKWEEQRKASGILMAPAPPQPAAAGSLKRPRTAAAGNQNVSCLVDGCKSDLSNCREYHRRHKVCEAHSKTPVVLVAGQQQRFCQQCSRFHLLVEFDEVKRSCRKRLDGHNRRRRKQQPELINSGNLFANRYGARLTSYPKILPTTATDANWSGVIKSEEDAFYGHHPPPMHFMNRVQQPLPHYSSSFNRSLKEGRQFPFLHEGEGMSIGSRAALEPAAVCQPLLKTISSAAESSGNKILFSDGLPPVLDSDCALSLLSSSTQASGINLGHMAPADSIPIGQPLHSDLQYGADTGGYVRSHAASENVSPTGFSCSGVENDHIGTVLVSGANEAELHCQSLFHIEGEGPSDGASHSLPFSWQ